MFVHASLIIHAIASFSQAQTYLKLARCRSLPPSAAGTLPERELPLRFLQQDKLKLLYFTVTFHVLISCRRELTVYVVLSTAQGFQELIH